MQTKHHDYKVLDSIGNENSIPLMSREVQYYFIDLNTLFDKSESFKCLGDFELSKIQFIQRTFFQVFNFAEKNVFFIDFGNTLLDVRKFIILSLIKTKNNVL